MSESKHTSGSREPSPDSTLHVGSSDDDAAATHVPGFLRAALRVLRGANVGRVFPLRGPITVIGRGDDADISLDDQLLSRAHATVTYNQRAREFRIEDNGSANGTMLNGSRVTSYALRHDDKLLVGDTLLLFEIAVDADAPDARQAPSQ